MKLRFNDLTLSRQPRECLSDMIRFAPVYAAIKKKFGLDKKVFSVSVSNTGCTISDLFNHIARNKAQLSQELTKQDWFRIMELMSILLIQTEDATSDFLSEELGSRQEASIEATSSCEGMLAVGFDYPSGRPLVQCLIHKEFSNLVRQSVCVVSVNQLSDVVVKRIAYCHAPAVNDNVTDKGFVSDDHGQKHFLDKADPDSRPEQWKSQRWYNQTKTAHRAKFRPGIEFGGFAFSEYERRVLLDAMKNGRYTEDKLDGYESDLGEIVGVSLAKCTSRIHLCIASGSLHMYPC